MNYFLFAYLDPTSGSLGYQVALSTFLAAGAAVKLYWKQLRRIFQGKPQISLEGHEIQAGHETNGGRSRHSVEHS